MAEVVAPQETTNGLGGVEKDVEVVEAKEASNTASLDAPVDELGLPLSSADGVIKKVFAKPLDSALPVPRAPLTTDQSVKYDELLKKVSSWTGIPTGLAAKSPSEPITDDDRMFLTRDCLLRYLRASKWHVNQAEKRLKDTLSWRREYGLAKHTADYISQEGETGKQLIMGYDIHARPCLYLFPSRQNTERSPKQIQYLVYNLERLIDLMVPGQETCCLLIDFNETKSGQGATVNQGRETLYILQNHYPERLGRALVSNVPWYIWTFFKLITPFIDPMTREKIKFNEDQTQWVPASHLLKECGGDVEMIYEHSEYWPALTKLAEQKRAAYRERWEKGGKRIGEHEDYLRGGEEKSLAETEAQTASTSGEIDAQREAA